MYRAILPGSPRTDVPLSPSDLSRVYLLQYRTRRGSPGASDPLRPDLFACGLHDCTQSLPKGPCVWKMEVGILIVLLSAGESGIGEPKIA